MAAKKGLNTQRERMREASKRRREQEKVELQLAIMQAAAELFFEVGYQGFSMRQVAERLGYTVATLYLYYENKDDLLLAVVGEAFQQLDQQMRNAAASVEDELERIHMMFEAYVRFGVEHQAIYSLMFLDRPDFLLRSRTGEADSDIAAYGVLLGAMQQAVDKGLLPTGIARQYSDALWSQAHGIVALAIRMPLFFDRERTQQATVTAIALWLASVRRC